jgi:hypothetical protein
MELQEVSQDMSGTGASLPDGQRAMIERRRSVRVPVLKGAKIIFSGGHSMYNCLVMDESAEGAFVDMGQVAPIPDEVILQFTSGATFRAQRRWSKGTKIGFEFIGGQIISQETASRLVVIRDILKNHGLPAVMKTLRSANFFDNVELRKTAEEAEAAQNRLDAALAGDKMF